MGNDPAQNMLLNFQRAYKPDIIAIVEPKIRLADLRQRFWRSLNMTFLVENECDGGLRPNIWVAHKSNLSLKPQVLLIIDQVIVIQFDSLHSTFFLGFIHASNSYIVRQ